MPDSDDLLTALRDVGVTPPRPGDAGDDRLQDAVMATIAGDGRRHARRSRRPRVRLRRPVLLRVSVAGGLAAAAVAGALVATGALAGSPASRFTFHGGSAVGPGQTQETAAIVRRIRARVAAQTGTVVQVATYHGGDVDANGSVVNPGWEISDGYGYVAADGSQDALSTVHYRDGSVELEILDHWTPDAGTAHGTDTQTDLEPDAHLYNVTRYAHTSPPNTGDAGSTGTPANPGVFSTPAEIQQALAGGQVTQQGTATIDGTPAIALGMVVPGAPGNPSTDVAIYVDAQTDQPLRTVAIPQGASAVTVSTWTAPTAANIALADQLPIGSDDTQTTLRRVYDATYHH